MEVEATRDSLQGMRVISRSQVRTCDALNMDWVAKMPARRRPIAADFELATPPNPNVAIRSIPPPLLAAD